MRPRNSDGTWKTPFNPSQVAHAESTGGDYTEGNAWQYTWHVQHDVPGLINLFGGEATSQATTLLICMRWQDVPNVRRSWFVKYLIPSIAPSPTAFAVMTIADKCLRGICSLPWDSIRWTR